MKQSNEGGDCYVGVGGGDWLKRFDELNRTMREIRQDMDILNDI